MSTDLSNTGRVCPVDYHYSPRVLASPADFDTEVLYVVGGLYGNLQALQAVEALAQREQTQPTIIFNGDFHFVDAEPDWFGEVDRGVANYQAIRGNVETEISRPEDMGAGCGRAYPASVSDEVVRCSNEIIRELHTITASPKGVPQRLWRPVTTAVEQFPAAFLLRVRRCRGRPEEGACTYSTLGFHPE
jgi:hypothetical protein